MGRYAKGKLQVDKLLVFRQDGITSKRTTVLLHSRHAFTYSSCRAWELVDLTKKSYMTIDCTYKKAERLKYRPMPYLGAV